jgi:predicted DNA-binding transcriptional regulator YafY
MGLSRIHRLLQIVTLLQGERGLSSADLMAELKVSRRTLFRDLSMLQEAGIPCYHDAAGGYRIAKSFFLPPINLTVPETLGLMFLAKTTGPQRQRPLMGPALSAILKLTSTVPEPIRSACSEMMDRVTVAPTAAESTEADNRFHAPLQRSIDECRRCELQYQSPSEGQPLTTTIDPYALHFAARSWYVMGLSHSHKEIRTFKLSRILSLTPLEARFPRPKSFSVSQRLGLAWQMIPEGKVYRVELEFSPKVAQNVSEVRWHPTQKHKTLPDGKCHMTFDVDGLNEISWWLCGYADHVFVKHPPQLRQLVSDMHRRAAELNMKSNDN